MDGHPFDNRHSSPSAIRFQELFGPEVELDSELFRFIPSSVLDSRAPFIEAHFPGRGDATVRRADNPTQDRRSLGS
jgi:hypothetical protein